MIKTLNKISFILLTLMTVVIPALAQSGVIIRNSTADVQNPVTNQTYLFQSGNKGALAVWNGSNWQQLSVPFSNYSAITAPGIDNDNTQGYQAGSLWYNASLSTLYICTSAATGSAVWVTAGIEATPAQGYPLISDTTALGGSAFEPMAPAALSGTGQTAGNAMVFNGTSWLGELLPLSSLAQGGATTGQAIVWSGSAWVPGAGGGGGGVTTFSSGNLSPLFTTSVANPTTAPALSYSLSSAGAGRLFGNFSGSSATPSYNAPGSADQILGVAHTGGGLEYKSIAAGANITVTPAAGTITISATAGNTSHIQSLSQWAILAGGNSHIGFTDVNVPSTSATVPKLGGDGLYHNVCGCTIGPNEENYFFDANYDTSVACDFVFSTVITADTTANIRIAAGLISELGTNFVGNSAPTTDAVWIRFDSYAGDTTYQCMAYGNGTLTQNSTSVSPSINTPDILQIQSNGTSVTYSINGTVVSTISTNLPPATEQLQVLEGMYNYNTGNQNVFFGNLVLLTN